MQLNLQLTFEKEKFNLKLWTNRETMNKLGIGNEWELEYN